MLEAGLRQAPRFAQNGFAGQAEEFAIDKRQWEVDDGMLMLKFSLKGGRPAWSCDYAVTGG